MTGPLILLGHAELTLFDGRRGSYVFVQITSMENRRLKAKQYYDGKAIVYMKQYPPPPAKSSVSETQHRQDRQGAHKSRP